MARRNGYGSKNRHAKQNSSRLWDRDFRKSRHSGAELWWPTWSSPTEPRWRGAGHDRIRHGVPCRWGQCSSKSVPGEAELASPGADLDEIGLTTTMRRVCRPQACSLLGARNSKPTTTICRGGAVVHEPGLTPETAGGCAPMWLAPCNIETPAASMQILLRMGWCQQTGIVRRGEPAGDRMRSNKGVGNTAPTRHKTSAAPHVFSLHLRRGIQSARVACGKCAGGGPSPGRRGRSPRTPCPGAGTNPGRRSAPGRRRGARPKRFHGAAPGAMAGREAKSRANVAPLRGHDSGWSSFGAVLDDPNYVAHLLFVS